MNWRYIKSTLEYEEDFQDSAWPWAGHKYFAYDLVCNLEPKRIVELGTHKGTSFFSFCQAAKDKKLDTEIIAIDTWQGDEHAGFYGDEVYDGVKNIVSKYYKNVNARLIRKTFDEALVDFKDGSVDVLHIDGLHTYDAVKHDFEAWLSKVSKDGVVLFHDIEVGEKDFGVHRLWNELKSQYKTAEFYHSFGLGVLFINNDIGNDFMTMQKELEMHYAYLHEMKKSNSIFQKEQELKQKENNNLKLIEELDLIKSLKIWKVRDAYLKIKNLLFNRCKRK